MSGPSLPNLLAHLARIEERVAQLAAATRAFFYELMLCGEACPWCEGSLVMIREGWCRCEVCERAFDPTVHLQRCTACEGGLALQVRRYACWRCGRDVASRFLFDGKVFDTAYFREKMAESRQRKAQQRLDHGQRQVARRSPPVELLPANEALGDELTEAINGLVGVANPPPVEIEGDTFDLARYQARLLAKLDARSRAIDAISDDPSQPRRERARLFIAAVFLEHAGRVVLHQRGTTIEVQRIEAQRKGQAIPHDPARADAGP